MVEIADDIRAEIAALLQEQKERHERGIHDAEAECIRQEVKSKALGLLGTVGLKFDDLAVWKMKQAAKKIRRTLRSPLKLKAKASGQSPPAERAW